MFSLKSYYGHIQADGTENSKELLQKIIIMLEQKKARDVQLKDNVIIFKGPTIFLVYLGNPLFHISKGKFQVKTISKKLSVFFEFYFKSYLVYCNIFALVCSSFAIFLLPTEPVLSNLAKIIYIFTFAIMAFGVTHFLPMLTFRLMVRKLKKR